MQSVNFLGMSPHPLNRLRSLFDKGGVSFVSIDVQKMFWRNLPVHVASYYPQLIDFFSDKMGERGVRTIWVAYCAKCGGGKKYCYNMNVSSSCYIKGRENEEVFIKCHDSAFKGYNYKWFDGKESFSKSFHEGLREKKIKTLVIGGMNTSFCVAATVKDALKRGYNVVIAEDLLADTEYPESLVYPGFHVKKLGELMKAVDTTNLLYSNGAQILDALPELPVELQVSRPQKTMWERKLSRLGLTFLPKFGA